MHLESLPQSQPTRFDLRPGNAERTALADAMGLIELKKIRFEGQIAASSDRDWRLTAHLGATVVQPCVVTLDPVSTRIEADVTRLYLDRFSEPETGEETQMPEDDTVEPLPAVVDLAQVMAEALALNLPEYPRKDGVELPSSVFAPPGVPPLEDSDLKPFAGLADLRKKLNHDKDS